VGVVDDELVSGGGRDGTWKIIVERTTCRILCAYLFIMIGSTTEAHLIRGTTLRCTPICVCNRTTTRPRRKTHVRAGCGFAMDFLAFGWRWSLSNLSVRFSVFRR
jgi:hypothetical protein